MSDFNPLRALGEEIAGLRDVQKAILVRERLAEKDLSEAEAELIAMRKLSGFVAAEIDRKLAIFDALQKKFTS